TAAQGFAMQTLTDASTIAWNGSTQQVATVTLAANRTMGTPSSLVTGFWYTLRVVQNGTGGWTLTWPSIFAWNGDIAPVLSTTANAKDLFAFFYDGTNLIGTMIAKGAA